jgi:putative ABC transport system permease protein
MSLSVQYAAFAWVVLTGNNWPVTMDVEGQPPAAKESDKITLPMRAETPDYFKLIGLPLTDGLGFRSTDDNKAPNVAIVNQAFTHRCFSNSNFPNRHTFPMRSSTKWSSTMTALSSSIWLML